MRHDYVGTDTQNYRWAYQFAIWQGIPDEIDLNTEIGFVLLQICIDKIGLTFRFLLLAAAILYIAVISKSIYQYSSLPWMSYFLFLTFGFFIFNTTMRQSIALSFTVLAYMCIQKKKLAGFLLFCAIAVSFHVSACIFIPVYWIDKLKWNKITVAICLLLFLISVVFSAQIASFMLNFNSSAEYSESATGGYFTLVLYTVLVLLGLIYKDKLLKLQSNNKLLFFMMAAVVLLIPIAKFNPALSRIYIYYSVYMILYIPNILTCLKGERACTLMLCFFIILGCFNFFYKLNSYGIRQIPYVFFWQEYPDELVFDTILPNGDW